MGGILEARLNQEVCNDGEKQEDTGRGFGVAPN